MASNFRIDILVNDKPVTTYQTPDNSGQTFIEGRHNSPYKIRLTNSTYRRVKAVVSVDGLSVMDGQPASENSQGYLIAAYGSITIDGWRTSLKDVSEFVFGAKGKSYSNKAGHGTQNTGVIGVAFFSEKVTYRAAPIVHRLVAQPIWNDYFNPLYTYTSMDSDAVSKGVMRGVGISNQSMAMNMMVGSAIHDSAPVAMGATAAVDPTPQNLGTQFGQTQESRVSEVSFEAEAFPSEKLIIYYDDRRGLEARGIVVNKRYQNPDPFPASNTFCKPV